MQTALATNGLGHGASAPINKALNILILDDSSFDRLRLRREITGSQMTAEVDEISCLCQLQEALGTKRYDLVVIDYYLPDGTGEEALDILLDHEINKTAKLLLVSGNQWLDEDSVRNRAAAVCFMKKSELGFGNAVRRIVNLWGSD